MAGSVAFRRRSGGLRVRSAAARPRRRRRRLPPRARARGRRGAPRRPRRGPRATVRPPDLEPRRREPAVGAERLGDRGRPRRPAVPSRSRRTTRPAASRQRVRRGLSGTAGGAADLGRRGAGGHLAPRRGQGRRALRHGGGRRRSVGDRLGGQLGVTVGCSICGGLRRRCGARLLPDSGGGALPPRLAAEVGRGRPLPGGRGAQPLGELWTARLGRLELRRLLLGRSRRGGCGRRGDDPRRRLGAERLRRRRRRRGRRRSRLEGPGPVQRAAPLVEPRGRALPELEGEDQRRRRACATERQAEEPPRHPPDGPARLRHPLRGAARAVEERGLPRGRGRDGRQLAEQRGGAGQAGELRGALGAAGDVRLHPPRLDRLEGADGEVGHQGLQLVVPHGPPPPDPCAAVTTRSCAPPRAPAPSTPAAARRSRRARRA